MSAISLRIPNSLHETVKVLARKDHVSINQMVITALAEKISALMAEDYLANRAKKASRVKFEHAMSRVSKDPPPDHDHITVPKKR
jgi:hypothetical protein